MVVGEGFEPSKLSRQIYSLLGLTAPQPHLRCKTIMIYSFTKLLLSKYFEGRMVPTAGIELATY